MIPNRREPRKKQYCEYRHNSPITKRLYSRDARSARLILRSNYSRFDRLIAPVVRLEDAETLIDAHDPEALQRAGRPDFPLLRFGHFGLFVRSSGRGRGRL